MKLYHYVHCPFCLRVRMSLGLLNIKYESVVLAYDDEVTPVKLTGKKILPAFEFSTGDVINESLDIIKRLDNQHLLNFSHLEKNQKEVDLLLSRIGNEVHSLCMPYWIWTPEFNEASRNYFQKKKEEKRGPFKDLWHKRDSYLKNLNLVLKDLDLQLSPFYQSNEITIIDIMLASHLWGMFIYPEFRFPEKIYNYLIAVKEKCHFEYHEDYFRP